MDKKAKKNESNESNEIELFHGDFKAAFEKQNFLIKVGGGAMLGLLLVTLAQAKVSTGFRYLKVRQYFSEEIKKTEICDLGSRIILLGKKLDENIISPKLTKKMKERRIVLNFKGAKFFHPHLLNDSNKCKVTFKTDRGMVGFVFVLKESKNYIFNYKLVDFDEVIQVQKYKF